MKFILNTAFVILMAFFCVNVSFNSFLLYADIEENNLEKSSQIINTLSSFIKENARYPSDQDISRLLGIGESEIIDIFGSKDSFQEKLLKGISSIIILNSQSSLECYQDDSIRKILQKEFINSYIYSWMDKYKKFIPKDISFYNNEFRIFDNRLFSDSNRKGLFDSLYDLLQKTIEFDSEEKYIKYIFASDLYNILCNDKEIKEKLQKAFITNYLVLWMKKKIESFQDKYEELSIDNITISSERILGTLFYSKLDLIRQIIRYDTEQKYAKYILKFKFSSGEYYNSDIRKILQRIFIVSYLFPWMEVNKTLPNISDFIEGSGSIDISYHKIFGNEYNIGIFDSFSDFMKVFIRIDEKEYYLRNILNYDFPEDCYDDIYVRGVLQTIFVKYYLCPWLDKVNRLPSMEDFSVEGIGLDYSKIFYHNMKIRIFYSMIEVMNKLEEIDVDKKYVKYTEEFNCKEVFAKKKKKQQEDL